MCGRYALAIDAKEIAEKARDLGFDIRNVENDANVRPRLNIAPHSTCWVLVQHKDTAQFDLRAMHWSLQPQTLPEKARYPTFNTRVESLDPIKPTWKCAINYRCIVFMQGYYEWHATSGEPYYVHSESNGLLCCLGVWDGRDTGEGIIRRGIDQGDTQPKKETHTPTFSIVTMAAPTPSLQSLHSRTPVIVAPTAARKWIISPWDEARTLVFSLKDDHTLLSPLRYYRVSHAVNSVKVERPDLNKKINEKKITDFFKRSAPEKSPSAKKIKRE